MQYIQLQEVGSFHLFLAVSILIACSFIIGAFSYHLYLKSTQPLLSELRQNEPNETLAEHILKQNFVLASRIRSIIKSIINSNYVLSDKGLYASLLQTPLRDNIQELRLVASALMQQQVLEPSKTRQDQFETPNEVQWEDLGGLIQEQLEAFRCLCSQHNISFNFDNRLPTGFHTDVRWLRCAIQELISNGIKNNRSDIAIELKAELENEQLFICVSDNGKGLPGDISNKLLSGLPSKVQWIRRSDAQLHSLNLFSIQGHLRSIGGHLHVQSAKHYATRVVMQMPMASNAYSVSEAKTQNINGLANEINETTAQSFTTQTERVLLIESNQGYASSLIEQLAKQYHVTHSKSIEAGVQILESNNVSCILIDAECDFSNGFSLMAYLQNSQSFQDIPVVLLGQNDPNISQLSTLSAGFSATIEKPFMPSVLKVLVKQVLDEKRKIQQRIENELAIYHANLSGIETVSSAEEKLFTDKFNALLEEHFCDESFTRKTAADLLFMSEKTLSRRLSSYYKSGFSELVKRFRLVKAKNKIRQGEQVTQVAYDCGFSSPSYFTQCFRSEYGFAPSKLNKLQNCA
ncbi:helix-turn-helix domain-containing protein [Glaciecola sp. 2405UD65-10]|uniref:helix-turn-helix domain-containing protein n=1 Tax=Glaciecola sp. 2405UD65-10 TaxID=3397244 RepID=UPI003B5AA64F